MADSHVIVIRGDRYFVVGPFANDAEMQEWADWNVENGDDPRWHSITLPLPHAPPEVLTIAQAKARILAA